MISLRSRSGDETSSKLKRYGFYALGEIVLIVIGVLIALSINIWNENRKSRLIEQEYLVALKKELLGNKDLLDELITTTLNIKEQSLYIINDSLRTNNGVPEIPIRSLYVNLFLRETTYLPNTAIIDELLNSGMLEKLKDEKLRRVLATWVSTTSNIKNREHKITHIIQSLNDLLINSGDVRQVLGSKNNENFGIFKNSNGDKNLSLFKSSKFINRLTHLVAVLTYLESNYYPRLRDVLSNVIINVDANLEEEINFAYSQLALVSNSNDSIIKMIPVDIDNGKWELFTKLEKGNYRFRNGNDWRNSWGCVSQFDNQCKRNGNYISVESGTYSIKLDLKSELYEFERVY